ncbi:MAG TPA: hypothetical protein VKP30_26190, partial [Polyangiaceae bacterium]|nr:hypothetical protein [Polyangiaceae bacterium]
MTRLLRLLGWSNQHRASCAILVSVGCTYYVDNTQTWPVEIAGATGVQIAEAGSVPSYTGSAGGATSLSSIDGGRAATGSPSMSQPMGSSSGVNLGGSGPLSPGADTSKRENGGNSLMSAGASSSSGALDKAGGSGYAGASIVLSGGTGGTPPTTPFESIAGQTGVAGGSTFGVVGMSADSFCGNLMDLKSIARELSFDVLTIDCLILTDATFERSDTIRARILEVRNQGISTQGEFCLSLSEPGLWLEATERIVISGPISLRGRDGKSSQ